MSKENPAPVDLASQATALLKMVDGEWLGCASKFMVEGTVTAADILYPPEVTIINTDLYLFTVDSDSAQLEMELTVQAGRGYSPAEERGRLPIGELPVDAIFTPVRRVNLMWSVPAWARKQTTTSSYLKFRDRWHYPR